ncbi:hypothetical protein [Fervidibacter sacchari]
MPKGTAVEKRLLQLAGEYAVAAQMALHGWHASITVGNFPEVDLVAYNPKTKKHLTVQVKSGRGQWGFGNVKWDEREEFCARLAKQVDVFVLVDMPKNAEGAESKMRFFVIPAKKLAEIARRNIEGWKEEWKQNPQPLWLSREETRDFQDRWDLLDEVAR